MSAQRMFALCGLHVLSVVSSQNGVTCARAVLLLFVIGIASVKAKGVFAAKRQKLPDCASSYLRKNHKMLYFSLKSTCVQPAICLWAACKLAKMGRGEPSISSPPID